MLASGSRVGRSHTPQDCCVRFAVVVAFHAATLATGRALPLTRTGLSPAGTRQLSWRTNGWPMCSPTDASPTPSRVPTHGSGPVRIATPSPWWTFTSYSLPVCPAHRKPCLLVHVLPRADARMGMVRTLSRPAGDHALSELRRRQVRSEAGYRVQHPRCCRAL